MKNELDNKMNNIEEKYNKFIKSEEGHEIIKYLTKASDKIISNSLPCQSSDFTNCLEFRQMFVKCFLHMMIGCDEYGHPIVHSTTDY